MPYHEKTRVGVLRGGPSSEYAVSLETGACALSHLGDQYEPLDIFIDREGEWHLLGAKREPHKILGRVDVVLNALHGAYGEDGKVQEILWAHGTPFSGSRQLGAALSLNKALAKRIAQNAGIETPHYRVVRKGETGVLPSFCARLFRSFPQPSLIKPLRGGSSLGVSRVRSPEEILYALELVFDGGDSALVEEFVEGREVVCGVIENFRNERLYQLLPSEIRLAAGAPFLEHHARRERGYTLTSPAHLTKKETKEIQQLAAQAHTLLGLRHYSSSDFIVHPTRGIYFLETDALPALGKQSPFAHSLQAIGCSFSHFIEHLVSLALGKK